MISGKHVHGDIPALDVIVINSTSPVVLQAFVFRETQLSLLTERRAEPPIPICSLVHGHASGITTGTLGTCCLPDPDCGLMSKFGTQSISFPLKERGMELHKSRVVMLHLEGSV